jgi:dynein heavy chain
MDYAAKLDERSTIKTYEDFVEATRKNLHVLFCTSPIGDLLRIRMRRFPALINCCSLDWFMAWPTEALLSCCKESFKPIKLIEDEKKEKVVKMVVEAHKQIEKLTDYFYQSLGRKVYVTPKSFLDMVNLMINILEKKKKESDKKINILENGTTKLETTEKDIEKLNVTITELMPKITKQKEEIAEKNVILEEKGKENLIQTEKVNESKLKVKLAQQEVSEVLKEVEQQRDECKASFQSTKEVAEKYLNENVLAEFKKEKSSGEFAKIKDEFIKAMAYMLNEQKNN